ncbi:MAG: hypothetical protein EBS86_11970, partial [Crocinitomicaceae bacterium]|nr:hypothetical protein [Crocinitomicaceae bacterium]
MQEPEHEPQLENNPLSDENVSASDEDVEFDVPDQSDPRTKADRSRYTEIDHLDEDPPIPGQRFVLISFVSPEGVMNCNIRGVKVRGVYETEVEARRAADKLRKKDKFFDVFVGEIGKWLPWDPDPMKIKEAKYGNKKLDRMMKKVHEQNNNSLNELVGRTKDIINDSKKTHKQRVSESIKSGLKSNVEPQEESDNEPVEPQRKPRIVPASRDPNARRARLRKLFEQRETEKNTASLKKGGKVEDPELAGQSKQVYSTPEKLEQMNDEINRLS